METKLTLYIVARNKSNKNYEILSITKDSIECPISNIVPNSRIHDQLYDLLKKYIDIDNNIINYIFLDIKVTTELNIVYFCCVPIELPIQNSYFLPLDSNNEHIINLQKIISII
jgi:hypothetical protein